MIPLQSQPRIRYPRPAATACLSHRSVVVALGAITITAHLWPLLIFWLSHTGRRHANFVEGAAVCWYPGCYT